MNYKRLNCKYICQLWDLTVRPHCQTSLSDLTSTMQYRYLFVYVCSKPQPDDATIESKHVAVWIFYNDGYLFITYDMKYHSTLHFTNSLTHLPCRGTIWITWNLHCRSQWPRGLRRRSLAARLLRLWVRIPPEAWMFVCCECCEVEVSAMSWSLVQRIPTDCGVSLIVI